MNPLKFKLLSLKNILLIIFISIILVIEGVNYVKSKDLLEKELKEKLILVAERYTCSFNNYLIQPQTHLNSYVKFIEFTISMNEFNRVIKIKDIVVKPPFFGPDLKLVS